MLPSTTEPKDADVVSILVVVDVGCDDFRGVERLRFTNVSILVVVDVGCDAASLLRNLEKIRFQSLLWWM